MRVFVDLHERSEQMCAHSSIAESEKRIWVTNLIVFWTSRITGVVLTALFGVATTITTIKAPFNWYR